MKNVRVKAREGCNGKWFDYGIYEGRKRLMDNLNTSNLFGYWVKKKAAIRNAKAMAKRIGIPYDPEIVKKHGC